MNRELSINDSLVSLGDNSRLVLELSTEPSETTLSHTLGARGSIDLSFDNLTTDRQLLGLSFQYEIIDDILTVTGRKGAEEAAGRGPNAFSGRTLFDRLVLVTQAVSVRHKHSVDIAWELTAWDEAGTYLVKGYVKPEGIRASEDSLPHAVVVEELEIPADSPPVKKKLAKEGSSVDPGLDFGPIKVVVTREDAERPVRVTLGEAKREETADQALWSLIRHRSIDFNRYRTFIDSVLCVQEDRNSRVAYGKSNYFLPFNRLASYALLKSATEMYLMQETGLAYEYGTSHDTGGNLNVLPRERGDIDEARRLGGYRLSAGELREAYLDELENQEGKALPYFKLIREKLSEVPVKDITSLSGQGDLCYGILKSKLQAPPLMELIWAYWHEEGGLVQTMNAISLRFQNVRKSGPGADPLANMAIDPLRPLNNIIWGYIDDERNRLTLNRRNLEYQYEYGIGLIGRAVQSIPVAEHRTFFLRGFHSLLRAAVEFYQQANFTTVIPDGFPILNHLREVHLMLAEGAHNQYGDLPWTARAEMMQQQWILARPEVREFLGGRIMVPYAEPWMDRVDNMKQLQGWNPTNISHFHDLGTFGEQLLLAIRYGNWNGSGVGATNAANWAYYWREEIQRYIHAYKAVTGVDLATDIVDARVSLPADEDRYLQPAQLIERQVALQQGQLQRNRQLSTPGPLTNPRLPIGVPQRRDAY